MLQKVNKSNTLIICLSAMALFFISGELSAQTGKATPSKDSLTVGELFSISLKLQLDKPYASVIYPDSTAFPTSISWVETQQFRVTDFSDSLIYKLRFFSNSDLTLPPFQILLVSANDTIPIYSNPVQLYFKTVLPSEDAELKPLKPVFVFKSFPWGLFFIALAVIIATVVLFNILRKKQPVQVVESKTFAPYINPVLELETILKKLKNEYDLSVTKDFKYFYTTLSDSVRTYYEDLYKIPALESTSRELFRFLEAFGVDHEMIKHTRMILNRSDMVKFAKFTPTPDDAWNCYQFAINFLDRAKIVDVSRISRSKLEYEKQFELPENEALKEQDR